MAESKHPIHDRVATNVRELRQDRGLSQPQVCEWLAEQGISLTKSALSKIENGSRRVTVDELVAIALALNVTPNRLLLHGDDFDPWALQLHLDDFAEPIALTPTTEVNPAFAWAWAAGDQPLELDPDMRGYYDPVAALEFIYENQPHAIPDFRFQQDVIDAVNAARQRRRAARSTPPDSKD